MCKKLVPSLACSGYSEVGVSSLSSVTDRWFPLKMVDLCLSEK